MQICAGGCACVRARVCLVRMRTRAYICEVIVKVISYGGCMSVCAHMCVLEGEGTGKVGRFDKVISSYVHCSS